MTLREQARQAVERALRAGSNPNIFAAAWAEADGPKASDWDAGRQTVVVRRTVSFYRAISATIEAVHQKIGDVDDRTDAGMDNAQVAIAANLKLIEMHHAEAVAVYRAACAKEDWRVQDFRKQVTGETLTIGDACSWLKSPAVRFLSLGVFRVLGIPVVNHTATYEVDSRAAAPPGMFVYDGDNGHRRFPIDGEVVGDLFVTVNWHGDDGAAHRKAKAGYTTLATSSDNQVCWSGSVRAMLAEVAGQIAEDYGWTHDDAECFILTANVPPISVIRVGLQLRDKTSNVTPEDAISQQTVTITVVPWLSQETVKAAYAKAQSVLRVPRSIRGGERSYQVYRFVTDLYGTAMPTKWAEPHRAWGKAYPTAEQFADYRDFRNAYKSARASVHGTQHIYFDSHSDSQEEK